MAKFWNFLVSGAKRLPRKTKPWDGATSKLMESIKVVPFKGTNSVLFSARLLGRPYPVMYMGSKRTMQAAYGVLIQFTGVEILDNPPEGNDLWTKDYKEIEYNRQKYYIRKIDVKKNPMLVRCSCKDYFFTWRWENFKYNALYGALGRKYIRKTPPPPAGYPYRNPTKVTGFCRHIYQVMMLLKNNDWMY